MNQEASGMKNIATDMNDKIFKINEQMDKINKNSGNHLANIRQANRELADSKGPGSPVNQKIVIWSSVAILLFLVLAFFVYKVLS